MTYLKVNNAAVGETVTFDEVVAVGGDKKLQVGTPFVEGCAVQAEVLEREQNEKSYYLFRSTKARKDYRRKNGHRQPYTLVKVTGIGAAAKKEGSSAKAKTQREGREVESEDFANERRKASEIASESWS